MLIRHTADGLLHLRVKPGDLALPRPQGQLRWLSSFACRLNPKQDMNWVFQIVLIDGITIVPNCSDQFITHGYYGTRVIDIYKIVGPIYVHPIYNSKSGSYSVAKWKIIMTHEMGHAFGYWGHYSSGAVMKASGVTTTYPNTNEIRHLKQLN
jgi:hypothetical protein